MYMSMFEVDILEKYVLRILVMTLLSRINARYTIDNRMYNWEVFTPDDVIILERNIKTRGIKNSRYCSDIHVYILWLLRHIQKILRFTSVALTNIFWRLPKPILDQT